MKGLEALNKIKNCEKCCRNPFRENCNNCEYTIIEKELKALEIIKKYDLCEEGLIAEGMRNYNKFSKEESDLLKEVLRK